MKNTFVTKYKPVCLFYSGIHSKCIDTFDTLFIECRNAALIFRQQIDLNEVCWPILDYATLCESSYDMNGGIVDGFKRITSICISKKLNNVCVYEKIDSNEYVMVIKGTDTRDELLFDAKSIVGNTHKSTLRALRQLIQIATDHKVCAVTGHSLGGYMASLLSSWLGLSGAGFQAPGISELLRGAYMPVDFKIVGVEEDSIGNFNNGDGKGHPNETLFIVLSSKSARERHGISNLREFIQRSPNYIFANIEKHDALVHPLVSFIKKRNAVYQIYTAGLEEITSNSYVAHKAVKAVGFASRVYMNSVENVLVRLLPPTEIKSEK
jgi:hypothetical protein